MIEKLISRTDANYIPSVYDLANKLNEVIEKVNLIEGRLELQWERRNAEESADSKESIQSSANTIQKDTKSIQYLESAKKEETPDYYRGMADQHAKDMDEMPAEAIADYKKRIIEKLEDIEVARRLSDGELIVLDWAIRTVEDTF